jgi:hypothetical protein
MADESTDGVAVVETPEATEETAAEEVTATEETEEDQPEAEEAAESEEEDSDDEEGQDDEQEEFEIDLGGNKHRFAVPKGALPADAVAEVQNFAKSLQGDYTRRTQAVVEREQSLGKREEFAGKLQSMNGDLLSEFSRGQQIKAEIAQLSAAMSDGQLWQSDPDRARQVSDMLARKQDEFQNTVARVSGLEGELTKAQEAEISRRRAEGAQVLDKRIKGFSEKAPEVVDYMVQNYGLDKEDAMKNWPLNPAFSEVAWKAMMFDRMQAQAKAKPKAATTPAQPTVKPKAKGSAGTKLDLVKDADKIPVDEWVRRERARLEKKRAS